jgi:P-type Ca2+ transporter type 2C
MEQVFRTETFHGLTSEQVKQKIEEEGYNELPSSKPKNVFQLALGVIKEPMFILLVACGTLYLILGDIQEGLMLMGFVFVIMGISSTRSARPKKRSMPLKIWLVRVHW